MFIINDNFNLITGEDIMNVFNNYNNFISQSNPTLETGKGDKFIEALKNTSNRHVLNPSLDVDNNFILTSLDEEDILEDDVYTFLSYGESSLTLTGDISINGKQYVLYEDGIVRPFGSIKESVLFVKKIDDNSLELVGYTGSSKDAKALLLDKEIDTQVDIGVIDTYREYSNYMLVNTNSSKYKGIAITLPVGVNSARIGIKGFLNKTKNISFEMGFNILTDYLSPASLKVHSGDYFCYGLLVRHTAFFNENNNYVVTYSLYLDTSLQNELEDESLDRSNGLFKKMKYPIDDNIDYFYITHLYSNITDFDDDIISISEEDTDISRNPTLGITYPNAVSVTNSAYPTPYKINNTLRLKGVIGAGEDIIKTDRIFVNDSVNPTDSSYDIYKDEVNEDVSSINFYNHSISSYHIIKVGTALTIKTGELRGKMDNVGSVSSDEIKAQPSKELTMKSTEEYIQDTHGMDAYPNENLTTIKEDIDLEINRNPNLATERLSLYEVDISTNKPLTIDAFADGSSITNNPKSAISKVDLHTYYAFGNEGLPSEYVDYMSNGNNEEQMSEYNNYWHIASTNKRFIGATASDFLSSSIYYKNNISTNDLITSYNGIIKDTYNYFRHENSVDNGQNRVTYSYNGEKIHDSNLFDFGGKIVESNDEKIVIEIKDGHPDLPMGHTYIEFKNRNFKVIKIVSMISNNPNYKFVALLMSNGKVYTKSLTNDTMEAPLYYTGLANVKDLACYPDVSGDGIRYMLVARTSSDFYYARDYQAGDDPEWDTNAVYDNGQTTFVKLPVILNSSATTIDMFPLVDGVFAIMHTFYDDLYIQTFGTSVDILATTRYGHTSQERRLRIRNIVNYDISLEEIPNVIGFGRRQLDGTVEVSNVSFIIQNKMSLTKGRTFASDGTTVVTLGNDLTNTDNNYEIMTEAKRSSLLLTRATGNTSSLDRREVIYDFDHIPALYISEGVVFYKIGEHYLPIRNMPPIKQFINGYGHTRPGIITDGLIVESYDNKFFLLDYFETHNHSDYMATSADYKLTNPTMERVIVATPIKLPSGQEIEMICYSLNLDEIQIIAKDYKDTYYKGTGLIGSSYSNNIHFSII